MKLNLRKILDSTIELPEGLEILGNSVFYFCSSLKKITVPDSVVSINGKNLFDGCNNLEKIVCSVSSACYQWASANGYIRKVQTPYGKVSESVWEANVIDESSCVITRYSGEGEVVNIPENVCGFTVTGIAEDVFRNHNEIISVAFPSTVREVGPRLFYECRALKDISLPDGLEEISDWMFYMCKKLEEVKLPSRLKKINGHAFEWCSSLKRIDIPDSVTEIGNSAFHSTILESVSLPAQLKSISDCAFSYCRIKALLIPGGVEDIGESSFSSCGSLTKVVIPTSIVSIKDNAFEYCGKLTTVYYKGTESEWKAIDIGESNDPLLQAEICYSAELINIEDAVITGIDPKTYTGESLTQSPIVSIGTSTLQPNIDYTLSYSSNTNAGIATVTINGQGIYSGTVEKTFVIAKAEQSFTIEADKLIINTGDTTKVTVSGAKETSTYTYASSNTKIAEVDQDGTVSGKEAGTVTITVKTPETTNYTAGSKTIEITVNEIKSISSADISGLENRTYNGKKQRQNLVIKLDGIKLTEGRDYKVSTMNVIDAGTATVTIIGIGNYEGIIKKTFTINPAPIDTVNINEIESVTYTGKELTPIPTVQVGLTPLRNGTDYIISYSNNTNVGTATVTITGIGNYTGSKTVTFKILPVGWYEEEGEQYYYKEDGTKLTNGWAKNGNTWYWMDNDGKISKNIWVSSGGKWYYMSSSGAMATGWQQIGNKWYYMSSSGAMTTGWQQIGSKWYYMSSGAMTTGWQQIGSKWYYMNSSGAMTTGWQQIGSKWYYMNSSGAMTTGWQKIGNKWYYMNSSGAMTTGWQKIGNKWYYMNSSGAMTTGWQKIGGKWYYMNSSGVMTTGWQQISGKWYYLKADGSMATGTQTIGGKKYKFNSSGVWIK